MRVFPKQVTIIRCDLDRSLWVWLCHHWRSSSLDGDHKDFPYDIICTDTTTNHITLLCACPRVLTNCMKPLYGSTGQWNKPPNLIVELYAYSTSFSFKATKCSWIISSNHYFHSSSFSCCIISTSNALYRQRGGWGVTQLWNVRYEFRIVLLSSWCVCYKVFKRTV
jgi:hypothetical protein